MSDIGEAMSSRVLRVTMDKMFAVMNTDRINRQGIRIPNHVMAESIETLLASCVRRGLPVGTPSHNAHDRHRPIGWSVGTELYLAADMTRQIGDIFLVETPAERSELETLCDLYWDAHHRESVAPYRAELETRLEGVNLTGAEFLMTEAASVVRSGLAAEIYPQYFGSGAGGVDKDGLVDMTSFLESVTEVESGVFHDRERDLILFAHPSFRRSLSRRNHLNAYFLDIFRETAADPALGPRLRLDPDMLGLPASARRPIELEYWRGPRFNDDISAIPNGVAEHKASNRKRELEGIDKTQIWWKAPESRTGDVAEQVQNFRTFECEELIENPSQGLGDDIFGCRYAHAEYNAERQVISHFDGAIRAYDGDAYLARIEASIDRAGKQAQYTKLFRFDGALSVDAWKRLMTGYYRGNNLIPEYFGEDQEEASTSEPPESGQGEVIAPLGLGASDLSALVSFHLPRNDAGVQMISQDSIQLGRNPFDVVELGDGAVSQYIKVHCDLSQIVTIVPPDGVLNLSPLTIGQDVIANWSTLVGDLAGAVKTDAASGRIKSIACSLIWDTSVCGVRLNVAGGANLVAALLRDAAGLIDPASNVAAWLEPFDASLKRLSPGVAGEPAWAQIRPRAGRLKVPRTDPYEMAFMIPEGLLDPAAMNALVASVSPASMD